MGNYLPFRLPFQRSAGGNVENFSSSTVLSYRFPPATKSGCFFANHFVMAGERFDNMDPETFLFGENNDLNYLPDIPAPFPYNTPNDNEPNNTMKCFVFLRKESLKLVKEENVAGSEDSDHYRVEFVFDADTDCAVRIFMMATEEIQQGSVRYTARSPGLRSEPAMFKKGCGQTYNSASFIIKPDDFQPSELNFIPGASEIPLVIQITVEDPDFLGQSISTIAGIEKLSDGLYTMKFLKQKAMVDGFCVMIQEIYGIENKVKEQQTNEAVDDDADDTSTVSECVICMSELRDTIMLPCRHLCLCNLCADAMRTKQNRCPICRANFHALLQIKAVRKKKAGPGDNTSSYVEEIPLIEALNGDLPDLGSKHRSSARRSTKKQKICQEVNPASSGANESMDKKEKEENKKAVIDIVVDSKQVVEIKPSEHVDVSLPGTPMGSDSSADSLSASVNLSTTRAQVTTPSNVTASMTEVDAGTDELT